MPLIDNGMDAYLSDLQRNCNFWNVGDKKYYFAVFQPGVLVIQTVQSCLISISVEASTDFGKFVNGNCTVAVVHIIITLKFKM